MTWNFKPSSLWQRLLVAVLLVAVLLVAAASALRLVFFGSLGEQIPHLLYFPALTLAALYGGLLTGLLATVLSAGLIYFWINQSHFSPPEWLALAVFVASGALIASIYEVMRRGTGEGLQVLSHESH